MTIWTPINGTSENWGIVTTTDDTPINEYFQRIRRGEPVEEGPLIDGIPESYYTPIDYPDQEISRAIRGRQQITSQCFGNSEGLVPMERLPSSSPSLLSPYLPLPLTNEAEFEPRSFAPTQGISEAQPSMKRKLGESEDLDEEQRHASQASLQNDGQLQSGASPTPHPSLSKVYEQDSGMDPKVYFVKGEYDYIPPIGNRRPERIQLGNNNPTYAWLAYAVIAKTPGHKIKLHDMFEIIIAWYPGIIRRDSSTANASLRHALTVSKANNGREFKQIKTSGAGHFWTINTDDSVVVDQKKDLEKPRYGVW